MVLEKAHHSIAGTMYKSNKMIGNKPVCPKCGLATKVFTDNLTLQIYKCKRCNIKFY